MTNTEKIKLEKALSHIQKCSGDCKNCNKCHVVTSGNGLYYAFICGVHGMADYFTAISETMHGLKNAMIEAIQFELS